MLPREKFDHFNPGRDPFERIEPQLRLGDLKPRFSGSPKLSFMISTYNRKGQLARSLECLARQEWKEFEVLIMDDGSKQDLSSLFEMFNVYLQLKTFKAERTAWRSCPSRAYKTMLEHVSGEVICIMHPEIMLHHTAAKTIYDGCIKKIKGTYYCIDENDKPTRGAWKWISLRPMFIHIDMQPKLDEVDWHTDVHNVQKYPEFMQMGGFAGRPNIWHFTKETYPWWFVGAAKRECPIWEDMPIIDGHGIIDMWMISYRKVKHFTDVTPNGVLCYHQAHQTSAVAPEGEQVSEKVQIK